MNEALPRGFNDEWKLPANYSKYKVANKDMIGNTWTFLLIKIISVPIFIYIVSIVGRRWGHSIGGLIVGLPLTSGPVLFFLTLEQGNSFGVGAAQGILMGLISVSTACLVYSRLAFRMSWPASVAGSSSVFFLVGGVLNFISAPLVLSYVGVLVVLLLIFKLLPPGVAPPTLQEPPKWEIHARIVAATAVVILITEGATLLGPHLSGLLTPFPAYATVLAAFIHKLDGASACSLFLRGVVIGSFTSASFFFVNALLIGQIGLLAAMGTAVLAGLVIHSLLFHLVKRTYV